MTPLQIAAANVLAKNLALKNAQATYDSALNAYASAQAGGDPVVIAAAGAFLLAANAALATAARDYAAALDAFGALLGPQSNPLPPPLIP